MLAVQLRGGAGPPVLADLWLLLAWFVAAFTVVCILGARRSAIRS